MKTYTITQIREYLQKSDSLGDALHFLSEERMDKANSIPEEEKEYDPDDIEDS